MDKNKYLLIVPLVLIGATILSGALLLSSYSFAIDNTDVVDEINLTVPLSCSLEGTGMTSHNASIPNGTYQADIGTTTVKVYCNDNEGFAIFASGYTGDEIGEANSTKLVNSTSAVNNTISTGIATSGNTSNWAMKLATNSGATYALTLDNGFNAYSAVPSTYTKVAHRDSGTDIGTGATGASLTTTYAVYVNQTQPAGTYSGKVIYTLVHPSSEVPAQPVACSAWYICYNPNTTTAQGQMGVEYASSGASVMLQASNFKRTGYGFAGWNTAYDYSGTTYGPQETITTPSDMSTKGLSLYAVWVKSAGTLQNWNGCSSLAQGSVTALTDSRDNDTYAVAKLADGKCWMIENLRLDDTPELSASNTHNPSLPLTNVYDTGVTSNHLSPTSSVVYDATTAPEGWCQDGSYISCNNQSRLRTDNTTFSAQSGTYSYGNYYNWYSATAGHGKTNAPDPSYHAPGDICPTGWHLPRGGYKSDEANNEYWSLIVTGLNNGIKPANYDSSSTPYYFNDEVAPISNAMRSYPNNFLFSGNVKDSTIHYRDTIGYYWTTSKYNASLSAFTMSISSNNISPGTGSGKLITGSTVRCIADT